MKKLFFALFLLSLVFVFSIEARSTQAAEVNVPCGRTPARGNPIGSEPACVPPQTCVPNPAADPNPNFQFSCATPGFAPGCTGPNNTDPGATGLVPCGVSINANGTLLCPCTFNHFFRLIERVYRFILWYIATPLAGLLIVVGGLLLILSGANQKLHDLGKQMLWGAAWGIGLIFCAYIIVSLVMMALGYSGAWSSF